MSHIIYPTTNLKKTETLSIEKGDGIYVFDDKGKRYIEGLSGLWCTALGYNNQELIEAIKEQMEQLTFSHMFGGKTHQIGMDLSDKLSKMVPIENAKVFFGNSGSDANDTHIKMLRYYFNAIGKPEKYKIIARDRSYHGVTIASASLTGLTPNHTHFDLPFEALGILRTDAPHYYRGANNGETESEFVNRLVNNLEKLIIKEGPETIAAFIAEPITGASGVIVPPDGYYEKVQHLLKKYNILFWADEVITAFGRTGNDFGSTTMEIQPQMMTLAKQLSSAYFPISASVISNEQYEAMLGPSEKVGVFGHGYTYSGHPVGCAAALKTLEIYERDKLFEKAAETGMYMQEQLLKSLANHPLVGEIRGKGLIAAIELVADKETKEAFPGGVIGAYAQQVCQNNGLIVRAVAGSSIALCPPLIITEDQIDEVIDILTNSFNETLAYAAKEKLIKK